MLNHYTIDLGYHNNSTVLLASIMRLRCLNTNKVIITYGKDATFDMPSCKRWYVVNITRSGNEYKGFVNKYWRS